MFSRVANTFFFLEKPKILREYNYIFLFNQHLPDFELYRIEVLGIYFFRHVT
jgi:uncharacterized protein YqgQ